MKEPILIVPLKKTLDVSGKPLEREGLDKKLYIAVAPAKKRRRRRRKK